MLRKEVVFAGKEWSDTFSIQNGGEWSPHFETHARTLASAFEIPPSRLVTFLPIRAAAYYHAANRFTETWLQFTRVKLTRVEFTRVALF